MSAKDKYYHFPICLLANIHNCNDRKAFDETLDQIAAWTYANTGREFVEHHFEESYALFLELGALESRMDDFDPDAEHHLQISWGAEAIGKARIHSYEETVVLLQRARSFVGDWEAKHGSHLYCRIRIDLFADARHDPSSLSPRDFLALCSLYALIGNKQYKQVSLNRIHYAASGCKSKHVFDQLGRQPTLTLKQVRSAIDKLFERNLFAAVTCQKRYKYYSHRLTLPKLREILQGDLREKSKAKASRKRLSTISIHQVVGQKKQHPSPPSTH